MSSHDSSEQTPLLEIDNNTAGPQVHRSFLPSIALPWRGGHCRPPKPPGTPPKIDSDNEEAADGNASGGSPHGSNKSSISRGLNGNGAETGPSDGPSDAANGNATKNGINEGNSNGNGQSSNLAEVPSTGVWGDPAGLDMRRASDESVLLFREAVGIPTSSTRPTTPASEAPSHYHHHHGGDHNDDPEAQLDRSRKQATGIYARILQEKKSKMRQASVLNGLLNACHVAQILVGAVLTTLGPSAQDHSVAITVLGATNTVLAGVFVLMKGQGLPDRFRKEALAFRRVQDWVEETDALIVAGVVGRDRREVGLLVETAFQKYNAVVANEQTTTTWPEASRDVNGAAPSGEAGSRGILATPVPVLPTPVPTPNPNQELLVDVSTPGGDGGPGGPDKSSSSVRAVSVGSARSHRSDNNLNQDGNGNGLAIQGGHTIQ